MEGQNEEDLLLLEEIDFEEMTDNSLGNLADAQEAEEAADRIMAEENVETKSLEATEKTDPSNPEAAGKDEMESIPAEASVTGFKYVVGRLVRLVRPTSTLGRVEEVVVEFARGKFIPWNFTVKSSNIYVMGFNLAKANLGLFLEYGEKCIVKHKLDMKRVSNITLWIGPPDIKPMMPSTHPTFRQWLKIKGMSIKNFSDWIKNSIDPVPFSHWEEDIYAGTVYNMMYDEANVAIGALLTLKLLYRKVNEVPLNDHSKRSFAYLPRENFFIWGNSVGFCDLRFLLKRGQSVLLQIFRRGDIHLQKQRPLFATKPNLLVRYTAYIGWVGNVRPSAEKPFDVDSDEMLEYLSKCHLTVENFEAMRAGLFTQRRGKRKMIPPKKRSIKHMPLVDKGVDEDDADREQDEAPKRPPRRPAILDRLGTKKYSPHLRLCGSCGQNDYHNPKIVVGTDLIRAVLEVKSANDPRVDGILKTQEDIDLAIKLTSVLSKALSNRFDMTQVQVQQIGHDLRSEHSVTSGQDFRTRSPHRDYRPRSPHRDYRPRSPRQDYELRSPRQHDNRPRSPKRDYRTGSPHRDPYRPRSPKQDYRPRSPKQDYRPRSPKQDFRPRTPKQDFRPRSPRREYRSRSPLQNYRQRSPPSERNHWEGRDNYYKEKNDIPNHHRRGDRERFDHRYPSAHFAPPSNRGQSERGTHNYFVDDVADRRSHHDYEKRPRDQDYPHHQHQHRHPSPPITSSTRIVDPFAPRLIEEKQQSKAQSNSGPQSHRLGDEDYNDMLKWDVNRVDAEFQRLSEQYNKMKEMRERTSSHSSIPLEEVSSSSFDYRNDEPRKSYESTRGKSPTLARLMESEMKAKSNQKQPFGTNQVQKSGSSYMENLPRDNFHR